MNGFNVEFAHEFRCLEVMMRKRWTDVVSGLIKAKGISDKGVSGLISDHVQLSCLVCSDGNMNGDFCLT